ncbi:Tetratricopeptide repeat-containing protein [Lishizhenia tianjinensis]|uniref:Tetratricopeptide repeat-containing protein n=1 Tax=Lishizhenia tianjinensis TaxID=477690 RepID=A0A1I6ZW49_9FLAO|nr:tetratricopeptide repeat protein [Lishizhenia tianjinensis]SFT66913.1 Tetratricopeptide repeat-containing protein [Lishizhenia tianjinensis]
MKYTLILFSLLFCLNLYGQENDYKLAEFYYNKGELEKALPYLQKVYQEDHRSFIFDKLLICTQEIEGQKAGIKLLKEQIDFYPNDINYSVQLGKLYEETGDQKSADKIYNDLIENNPQRSTNIINLATAFRGMNKPLLALEVLEQGRKNLGNTYPLHFQFAQVYSDLDRKEDMVNEYITLLDYNERMLNTVTNVLPRYIDFENPKSEDVLLLKRLLLENIQRSPNTTSYTDLLIWTFIQTKEFNAAYIQAKALDKRTRSEGEKLIEMGTIALNNKAYTEARKAFAYVMELGPNSPYYYQSEYYYLQTSFLEITENKIYDKAQLAQTIEAYQASIERIGYNNEVVPIALGLAHIQTYYSQEITAAKTLLERVLQIEGLYGKDLAETKMALADVLVIQNDIWEASLLYMQVESQFKFETIGAEAKFKNAQVFYYAGDFEWAQSQLKVLKQSTSKLIANDALELSLLITDNLGLDSNYNAMRQFANADLLLEQHKYEEAFAKYDSILKFLPFHGLADEVLLRKAQAYEELQEWDKAIEALELITTKYASDILMDNALMELGIIYEVHKGDKTKAMEYYLRLMKEHRGSLFVTEARKRYRNLQAETTS